MKKSVAIKKAGSAAKLARILNITQPAISHWGEEIPHARVWQLRVLKPNWFKHTRSGTQVKV